MSSRRTIVSAFFNHFRGIPSHNCHTDAWQPCGQEPGRIACLYLHSFRKGEQSYVSEKSQMQAQIQAGNDFRTQAYLASN